MTKTRSFSEEVRGAIRLYENASFICICEECKLPCYTEGSPFPYNNEGDFDTFSACCKQEYDSYPKEYAKFYENSIMQCEDCGENCKIIVIQGLYDVTECCGSGNFRNLSKDMKKLYNIDE